MAAMPKARLAPLTIYDSYPLSLRTILAEDGLPAFARTKSHSLGDLALPPDRMDDRTYLDASFDTIPKSDGGAQSCRTAARACGTFHPEVFETKERSKVLSALRHRGKAVTQASGKKKRARRRPMAPSTFTVDDVLRAGLLTKQGSWRRNWKTRFFILRSDCPSLCYFTSEDKLELLGDIPITEDTIVLDRSGGHAPFRFQIRTEAHTLLLEAASLENQTRWIESCQELADAIRASKFSVNLPVSSHSIDGRSSLGNAGQGSEHYASTLIEASATSSQNWDELETSRGSDPRQIQTLHSVTGSSRASGSVLSGTQEEPNRTSKRLYDLSLSVVLGKRSKLVEHVAAVEKEKDRTACFVSVSGYCCTSNTSVELGVTDAVKLTSLVAASGVEADEQTAVPFSLVLTAELEQFDHLRLVLCKTQLTQSPGTIQGTLGVGKCLLDHQLLSSTPCAVTLTERNTSSLVSNNLLPQFKTTGGTSLKFANDSDSVQIVVQVFRSVPLQSILSTTGIDMANAKYLIPTTRAPGRETSRKLATDFCNDLLGVTRGSHVRTFMEDDTFLTNGVGTLNNVSDDNLRYVAVDEILRVPRSTFALPIAYLDFLEEQALERSRWLQKQVATHVEPPRGHDRVSTELEFLRKKQEEYLKQRQFLIRQEKRLLAEEKDGKFFHAAKRAGMVAVATEKDNLGVATAPGTTAASTASGETELVAPFKRSTFKNLNLWQFLPTNMQDQFLCTCKPPISNRNQSHLASRPFVWHTMTMGCPAAHTKGFANGGYPASVPIQTVGTVDDEPVDKSQENETQSPTSPISSLRSSNDFIFQTRLSSDDSLTAFKLRLELQDRLSTIGSQILSATAACVLASLDLAVSGSALHQAQLNRAATFGFLMHFESLLSTQGKEYGMLEDFAAGARWLRNVFIQFRRHSTSGTYFSLKRYTPSGSNAHDNNCLLLTMGIDDKHMAILPQSLVSGNGVVAVHCVLFTQGVNEKQSLVHAYKSSAVKLQERVNRDNLLELKRIYALYHRLRTEEKANRVRRDRRVRANSVIVDADDALRALDRHDLQVLDDLLIQIEHHICSSNSQYKKNVALLIDSSDFCRALGGARVTCCKSGKDRTAMSVTLEQARLLCAELQTPQGAALCANMRLYGVRRRNVFMNTKADKFAFNEMQRKMLPDCFKPPVGTYKSGKT